MTATITVLFHFIKAHGSADQVVNHGWGKASHALLETMISDPQPRFMTIKVYILPLILIVLIILTFLVIFFYDIENF